MLQVLSPHDMETRRAIGAYYTSDSIAEALANWAICAPHAKVLEPSFGGGALICAAINRLARLGRTNCHGQIVGYDVDSEAAVLLRNSATVDGATIITADFLSISPTSDSEGFDCIIANPPYVRHHRNNDALFKLRCQELGLPRSADLWCLFVIHALKFLKPGGRAALVLPASFLFAQYAEVVRKIFRSQFRKVKIVRLAFKSFAQAGADEKGVLILADDFKADETGGWAEAIAWSEGDLLRTTQDSYEAPPSIAAEFAELVDQATVATFQDLASIRIGVVTGANRYFIINEDIRARYKLPIDSLIPVAARTSQISGIRFDLKHHAIATKLNHRVWLLSPKRIGNRRNPVHRYLESIPDEIKNGTLWFRKRAKWFKPEPIYADAILTYMNHQGPKIALLSNRITATNTFHLITLKGNRSAHAKQKLALGFLTSLSQASAEIEGRAYGGGLLKIEPAGLKQVVLPDFDPDPAILRLAFAQADQCVRSGNSEAAREIADRTLLFPALANNPEKTAVSLQRIIQYSRQIRMNSASKNAF